VHIIEASKLKPENRNGTSDPVVYVELGASGSGSTLQHQKQARDVLHYIADCNGSDGAAHGYTQGHHILRF
jgi:hypothetical protein